MKKQVKRIITVCLMVMVVLSVSNVFAAGNVKDWEWASGYSGTTNVITPHREKRDTTEAYLYYKSGSVSSVRVNVYGSKNYVRRSGVNDGVDLTVFKRDKVFKPYLTVKKHYANFLANTVKERGYKYCYLKIRVGKSNAAEGTWSPDSVSY